MSQEKMRLFIHPVTLFLLGWVTNSLTSLCAYVHTHTHTHIMQAFLRAEACAHGMLRELMPTQRVGEPRPRRCSSPARAVNSPTHEHIPVYTCVYSQLCSRPLNLEMRGWCLCVYTGAEGIAGCAAGRTPAATGIGGRAVCPRQAPAASHHVSTLSGLSSWLA